MNRVIRLPREQQAAFGMMCTDLTTGWGELSAVGTRK
jgi:hypothetical protein